MADTNADGVGNSWLNTGVGTLGTASLVADAAVLGNHQRIRIASGQAGQVRIYQDINIGTAFTGSPASAATDTFTKTAHGITAGSKFFFTTAVSGVSMDTPYYARDTTANTFKAVTHPRRQL